jgi:hypothetical protein
MPIIAHIPLKQTMCPTGSKRKRIRWFEVPAVCNKQPCACKAFMPISTRPLRVLHLTGVHLLSKVLEGIERNRNHAAGFPLKIVLWCSWYRYYACPLVSSAGRCW